MFTNLMPGASNDGGEDSPGGVVTGEAGLAHAGAIVTDQSGNVLVTHLEFLLIQRRMAGLLPSGLYREVRGLGKLLCCLKISSPLPNKELGKALSADRTTSQAGHDLRKLSSVLAANLIWAEAWQWATIVGRRPDSENKSSHVHKYMQRYTSKDVGRYGVFILA